MTVTFKGQPVTLAGAFIAAGVKAPNFSLVKNDMSEYSLENNQ